jgi:Sigma-70, region 4
VEDWAEIRRLHRAEGVPIKEIARRLGIARNTVRAALRADQVPRRERGPRVRLADAVENQLRLLFGGVADRAGDGDRGTDRLAVFDDHAQRSRAPGPPGGVACGHH